MSQLVLQVGYIVAEGFASTKDLNDYSNLGCMLMNRDYSQVRNHIESISMFADHFFEGR